MSAGMVGVTEGQGKETVGKKTAEKEKRGRSLGANGCSQLGNRASCCSREASSGVIGMETAGETNAVRKTGLGAKKIRDRGAVAAQGK